MVTGASQKSESRPLTAAERQALFQGASSNISNSTMDMPTYQTVAYVDPGTYQASDYVSAGGYTDPGAAQQMEGGDYDRLERNVLASRTAGLDRAKQLDAISTDADLSKRGIWSSGLAERAQADNNERYAAQYQQAGAEAATQRYGMQQTDMANTNTYNMSNAQGRNTWNMADATSQNTFNQNQSGARNSYNLNAANSANTFNSAQAQQQYESAWKPLEYLAGIWDGTAGTKSTASGWNAGVSAPTGGK